MPHLESYDSFQTKKSREKKERAKAKSGKTVNIEETNSSFVIKKTDESTGIVIETRYNDATILYRGELITASLKKGLNMICNKAIFPGDIVVVDQMQPNEYTIVNLLERKNVLSRNKKDRSRITDKQAESHTIAANIDMAVIVVSAKTPPLHPKFIDRYLMILQDSGIDCAICLNKSDLKTAGDEEILDIYRKLKIPVIETSAVNHDGIDSLKDLLREKQSIFVGHSGVGKSSLINSLMDSENIKTSHVSSKSGKGRHTTTTSKYYVWDEGSSVIDTPGIRSLDVSSFRPSEIKEYFPEFEDWGCRCKYSNCLHHAEPLEGCMVKQAVKAGIINRGRYESYIRILNDINSDRNDFGESDDNLDK